MNEPTILDYVKSFFKDRKSFGEFTQTLFSRAEITQEIEAPAPELKSPVPEPEVVSAQTEVVRIKFPWQSLLALVVALLAQRMFEPPRQNATLGAALYIFAFALALWMILRGEWTLAPLPASTSGLDPLTVRGGAFILSLIFGAATFYFMKDNTFTAFNLTLLALTIFLHLWAFWLDEPETSNMWPRLRNFFARREWTIIITRWGLLMIAIAALILFFRFYRLSAVPLEMTSDHAEKLQDVYDILQGKYSIFFPRNTGREPLYIYLAALIAAWYSGVSFLTLKIAAVIGGLLTLPYIYLIGKEIANKQIGMLAVLFAGIAYWPNVIERFGLRISFYPLFAAITLYYLIRGLRRQRRNDFILAGIGLGLGLNGYTPFRIMPFVVIAIVGIYWLHAHNGQIRKQVLLWLGLLALTSWVFFIPLARAALEMPDKFGFRALSRLTSVEQPLPGPAWQIFLSNLWEALKQFNWYNGNVWVHSIPGRPALDVVSGVLFLLGVLLMLVRYIRSRHWEDLTLLLSVPMLQMPSILSLAFPIENPSLNRTGGAIIPVFLLVAFGLDSLLNNFSHQTESIEALRPLKNKRPVLAGIVLVGLLYFSIAQNYDLVFRQYNDQYYRSAWNTSELGTVMRGFIESNGPADNIWIIPYPYWVDTRLPPVWAGLPIRDFAIKPENIGSTLDVPGEKLFMFNLADVDTMTMLMAFYPQGKLTEYHSPAPTRDFYIFRVPALP